MRTFYGTLALALSWLVYFSLAHVLDREGVTGALLAQNGQSGLALSSLALLIILRFACLVVLPSLLAGWILARLGQRVFARLTVKSA
jgi:hypothetical protein